MRLLARWALRLVTAATSVFIAACYGVQSELQGGRVVRAGAVPLGGARAIDVGIPGIEVSCLDAEGALLEQTVTGEDGDFFTREPCAALAVADVDGDANGGLFAPRTLPVEGDWTRIQLEPAP